MDIRYTCIVERGSSVEECRTRNYLTLLPFRSLGIFVLFTTPQSTQVCIIEYIARDSGGNVTDIVVARNCCMTRMLPGEAELVSE